jgi:glycerophosphoryl diester phosphodiesterase
MRAIDLGMDALEMDVVISKDHEVVIAHEPYMPADICAQPDGSRIIKEDELNHNLYKMDYSKIARYNCGLKHPRFEAQESIHVHRPLLKELFQQAEQYIELNQLSKIQYTIEIKCDKQYDDIYHPAPVNYVGLVLEVIQKHNLSSRCVLQSFDYRILREIRSQAPDIRLSMLIQEDFELSRELDVLGFQPEILGPRFDKVDANLISSCHSKGIRVVPWTVNEVSDMELLIALGVDGIITDYPDRKIACHRDEAGQ